MFEAKIVRSNRENMTAREKIALKDTTNAQSLEELTREAPFVVVVHEWAVIHVSNDMSENKEYDKYLIVDPDGAKFATGSPSFWNALSAIIDELESANDHDDFTIEVVQRPSRNYSGKTFLSCALVE